MEHHRDRDQVYQKGTILESELPERSLGTTPRSLFLMTCDSKSTRLKTPEARPTATKHDIIWYHSIA